MASYLMAIDDRQPLTVFCGQPEIAGRFFYAPDMNGFNFTTRAMTLADLLDQLLTMCDDPAPPARYAGAAPTSVNMRRFADDNHVPADWIDGEARIWIGNRTQIATHYDISPNLACVVAGHRRFTLFPPEQIGNLYVGPLERTPAGQPVSMVDPLAPDLARYPRFARAQAAAIHVDLEPGDALYIPSLWWHHVEARGPFNVLVNYWHGQREDRPGFAAMMHAIYAIRELPEGERRAWQSWFDHFVFADTAQTAAHHLPDHARGVQGRPSPRRDLAIINYLLGILSKRR